MRRLPLVALAIVAVSALVACRAKIEPPVLRMPFQAGVVVLCQQGNHAPEGWTHSYPNALHALDLSSTQPEAQAIVAAARGKVIAVVTGSRPMDDVVGGGFGNSVALDHGNGYQTFYAHLSQVDVKVGDRLEAGQPLGRMGDTGRAGNPHLHFSLHRQSWWGRGLGRTVPSAIVTADVTDGLSLFTALSSPAFVGVGRSYSRHAGHLYASENRGGAPTLGKADGALVQRVSGARLRLLDSFAAADVLLELERDHRSPAWALQRLTEITRSQPGDRIAWYWQGVMILRTEGDSQEARMAFGRVLPGSPGDPSWLRPWTELRLAELELASGRVREARSLLERVLAFPDDGSGFRAEASRSLALLDGSSQ